MNRPIYLDYNATTPADPIVIEAMLPYLREAFGNASSVTHSYGWEASQAVEISRKSVAQLISAPAKSIIWTSGATESNNLALLSYMRGFLKRSERAHLITTLIEHKAVLDVAYQLENEGVDVTFLKPDRLGRISEENVLSAIKPHTKMVSVIFGQNEIGTINPIAKIGEICRKREILFHTDAAQALGKTPIDVEKMGIDLLSASGHKIYAPKGIGFLYVRHGLKLDPIQFGGSQEGGCRPGTLNVPCCVALGKACEIAREIMDGEIKKMTNLRDQFIADILREIPTAQLNGDPVDRLYSNISLSFRDLSSDIFALGLTGLALSSGSACSAGAPSHVLSAIGLSADLARATLRIGIGRFTLAADLDVARSKIVAMVNKNRELSNT